MTSALVPRDAAQLWYYQSAAAPPPRLPPPPRGPWAWALYPLVALALLLLGALHCLGPAPVPGPRLVLPLAWPYGRTALARPTPPGPGLRANRIIFGPEEQQAPAAPGAAPQVCSVRTRAHHRIAPRRPPAPVMY